MPGRICTMAGTGRGWTTLNEPLSLERSRKRAIYAEGAETSGAELAQAYKLWTRRSKLPGDVGL